MVLVPAIMELLGRANWWFPNWIRSIVPRITVEPATTISLAERPSDVDLRDPSDLPKPAPRS
jgi:uncharacterized membrane protein YdfJ with MMPL/SSD domain